jgi:hypothetical protein
MRLPSVRLRGVRATSVEGGTQPIATLASVKPERRRPVQLVFDIDDGRQPAREGMP